MSALEGDPIVRRAVDELKQLPAVDAATIRGVVEAAAAARVMAPADEPLDAERPKPVIRRWGIASLVAAAAIGGFIVRGQFVSRDGAPVSSQATSLALREAASTAEQAVLPQPHQFVFRGPGAHSVSVVGDFNRWSPTSAPMIRSTGGDVWSVTVPIVPGRHVYAFLVDDSLFTLDPREPKTRDPDLGVEGSVIIVGRP